MGPERIQKANRKRGTRSESGSRRQIAMVLNLDTVMDSMFAQDVTDGGMLDFIDGLCQFDLRINDAMPVFE